MDHVETNIDKSRSPLLIPFAILLLVATVGGVATIFALLHHGGNGTNGTGDNVPEVSSVGPTTFSKVGPMPVGQTTLHLKGGSAVEVWYPAAPDSYHGTEATYNVLDYLPASILKAFPKLKGDNEPYRDGGIRNVEVADGRHPLVLFSHGFTGFDTQSSFLTSHLASWGFVVAAPEHGDRDLTGVLAGFLNGSAIGGKMVSKDVSELSQTIDLMSQQSDESSSLFNGHIDLTRIGAVGHSAGGSAVEKLAVTDKRVDSFIGLAGASYGAFGQTDSGAGASVPNVPGLIEYGTLDGVVKPSGMVSAYNALKQPKRLIALSSSGHLVFADICKLAPKHGGLIGAAEGAGLPVPDTLKKLGSDGCSAPAMSVTEAWPAIRQSVTAQLRWTLGFDDTNAGLEGLQAAFNGIVAQNTTEGSVSGPVR
jgi:dienelactone hydrolase